jgi:hypothetical protein
MIKAWLMVPLTGCGVISSCSIQMDGREVEKLVSNAEIQFHRPRTGSTEIDTRAPSGAIGILLDNSMLASAGAI